MANKLDRIEKDIEKTKAKIAELQKQLRELEAAKTEQENLQIIQLVRGLNMKPEGVPVTPEGNATLVDDFYGDKQIITVTTKAGNYFYILIDQANEDKETAVHFLNQVDDADLQALLEDGEATPETCTCTTKCKAGAVNTNCPVCKTNMTECTGPEPEPQEPEETEQPQEDEAKSIGMGGLVVFLVVALIGGGAALYFFKFKKPKADTKGGDELDEYDFGEDEDEPAPEDEVTPEVDDSMETDKE